ncbi:hypothetical protein [Mesorhizobium sp. M0217]|uniref:hypothetical protein n=1 Tax=unclassified Mesorhizobium TaxID=325217 RepID=UPI00333CFE2E
MNLVDQDAEIMRAVERFAATATVPILHEYMPDEVDQIGTGTLFNCDGRLMLVTAGHIFDEIKPEDLVLPSRGTAALHGIGPYFLHRPDNRDIDIAIVELRHQPSIDRARSSWKILEFGNTATASEEGWFVLTGYPSIKSKRVGGLLGSSLLSLHSRRLTEVPPEAEQPVHPDLDLFFEFAKEAENLDGTTGDVPHLGGCSGGPIWEYLEPQGMGFWTPEQCLRLVGVQSAFNPSAGYFRAKSGIYVRFMIDELVSRHPHP